MVNVVPCLLALDFLLVAKVAGLVILIVAIVTVLWTAFIKGVSDVRKNYGRRRVCSAYSNVFDVCAIFFWQKIVGYF